MPSPDRVAVLASDDSCPRLPLVVGSGEAFAVVWPGVGANMRSMHRIVLRHGASTVPLRHAGEAVYYVLAGAGTVTDRDAGTSTPLVEGSMIHIDPETTYVCEASSGGMELVGGPCPAEPEFYRGIGLDPEPEARPEP